jgi:trehalose 6-phosphate synthase/phosphatase
MAQKFSGEGVDMANPPAPVEEDYPHPGLLPEVTNVPVTPGINPSTYASPSTNGGSASYFPSPSRPVYESIAQSPLEAAEGAKSDYEVLRRMSLNTVGRREALADIDPREAYPNLSLTGSVISATFCVPYELEFRKGSDWVSHKTPSSPISSILIVNRN